MTRNRIAATTGVTALATVSLGLVFAPAALAAVELTAPTAPATVTAAQEFEIEGAECLTTDPDYPAEVALFADVALPEPTEEDFVYTAPAEDGTWSATVSFPAGTTGEHEFYAFCDNIYGELPQVYAPTIITVTAPPVVTPPSTPAPETPAPEAPKPSAIRGESANTPGVSAQTTAATTKTAVPGQKVVKVYKGFQPFEKVTLTMHSTPQVLGTFTADADGVLEVEFTLPAGTTAGMHTLVLEGPSTYFQEGFQVSGTLTTASSDSLAYTGASVGLPLALGAGLLVAGGGALVATRRRAGASQA
ncbi:hypothetical protein [Blastococcus sp. VKM Ac-2987]|uniref:hypothetical protein n=1 Tax=Blastococcus sp. VKM Ac-2987 TaxID=3004141 RepID=UPI0022AB83C2|nr:hypothetical protein [Blastococcus sp. VKM Ac-2987]MCZ2859900.1 hypothetical protein [Blastococcus sp. VKM Ac-2987]